MHLLEQETFKEIQWKNYNIKHSLSYKYEVGQMAVILLLALFHNNTVEPLTPPSLPLLTAGSQMRQTWRRPVGSPTYCSVSCWSCTRVKHVAWSSPFNLWCVYAWTIKLFLPVGVGSDQGWNPNWFHPGSELIPTRAVDMLRTGVMEWGMDCV